MPSAVRVRVQLFGALAGFSAGSVVEFDLARDATVADVLKELCARMDDDAFRALVLDDFGLKHRYCRLFLNGDCIEDTQTRLESGHQPNRIEMILLIAREGG